MQAVIMEHGQQVDLSSCADEPIHIPGSIQPHGAILFFSEDARLAGWSENAPAMLGVTPQLGLYAEINGRLGNDEGSQTGYSIGAQWLF